LCFSSALILTFSPRRRNSLCAFLFSRLIIRQIQSHEFSRGRQTILLLLGEKAGMREDVHLTLPGRPGKSGGERAAVQTLCEIS
jgi:hypothetical protein